MSRKKREKKCGIYKITNPIGQSYIGQTKQTNVRIHPSCYKKQRLLKESIAKYGWENHRVEVIEECEIEKLNEREPYWIAFFGTFDTPNGLNLQSGGKYCKHAEEVRIRNGLKSKGRPSPMKGKKISEQALKNRTGVKRSEETKLKQSLIHKGVKKTKEHAANAGKTHRKYVLDTETGVIYFGVQEASDAFDINYAYLQAMLNVNNKTKNKTTLKYLDK